MRKREIAIIGLKGLPAFGGAAAVGENIIEQLKDKYNFTIYSTSSHTYKKTGNYNGYKQIVFKKIPFKSLNTLYYYVLSAFHAILFGKYDLIHLHHRDAAFITPLLKFRYKVILTTHGMVLTEKWKKFRLFFQLQDVLFLNFADIVTCVSKKDEKIVKKHRNKKVVFIPNGISSNIVKKEDFKVKKKIVFAAARIVPSKGCHILLKALQKVNFDLDVSIVGDFNQIKSYSKELLKISKDLNVKWFGLIKDKNKFFQLLKDYDLFIFPSTIESMSMMLLEAASIGLPMIVSDIEENRDLFNKNEVLFFKADNVEDLENKIIWAFANYDEMLIKSRKALEKLKLFYSWKNISISYMKIYDDLIKKI